MFSHDSLSLEQFEVREMCGTGSSSTVVHATHVPSGAHVALKRVSRRWMSQATQAGKAVEREINMLRQLKHKNIVRLYSFFKCDDCVVLVLEPCEYSLKQLLEEHPGQRFSTRQTINFAVQIAAALAFTHERGFAHRDVKLENILLRKGCLKLADFGSCRVDGEGQHSRCGTLDYLAPEVVTGGIHTCKVDVWSLGVAVAEMLFGYPPFYCDSERATLHSIVHAEPHLPADRLSLYASEAGDTPYVADQLLLLTRWALQKQPHDRPTALELFEALSTL